MSQPIEIKLPWPAKALHSNFTAKHWGPKARATAKARRDAAYLAKEAKVPCWPEAEIMIEYYPPSMRGDPSNPASAMKAYLDGLADAMQCDDKRFRVDYPRMFAGTKKGGEVIFRIYPGGCSV